MDEHELASQVLAAVDDAAYRNSATRISTVHLAVGGRRVLDLDRLQAVLLRPLAAPSPKAPSLR